MKAKTYEELVDENAALAAHLERLQRALKDTMVSGWSVPGEEALVEVFSESPQVSLARRDLLKQAEVLEEAGRYIRCEEDAALLRINTQELRRQAEGENMTEHDIKINAMDAAHREISSALRRLAVALSLLEDAELPDACGALRAAYDILRNVNPILYEKIHTDHEGDSK